MIKRGLLVGVLLFIFLLNTISFAEETKIPKIHGVEVADNQIYTSVAIGCDNCGESGAGGCKARESQCDHTIGTNYPFDWDVGCLFLKKNQEITLPRGDTDDGGCASDLNSPIYKTTSTQGCWLFVSEEDSGDDQCGYAQVKFGTSLNSIQGQALSSSILAYQTWEPSWEDNKPKDPECMLGTIKWKLNNPSHLICADDHFWHSCIGEKGNNDLPGDFNSVTWTNNFLHKCSKTKDGISFWDKIGEDKDHDVHLDNKDDCGNFDLKQNPPVCQELETLNDCKNDKKYAVCAQCIHKDAPEIAGDGVDNNCDGKDVADLDDDAKACTDGTLNLAGESYFWMGADAKDGNKKAGCCGDDADDFGKVFDTDAGPKLCLNKDPKKVGVVGGVEQVVGKTSCNGDWCAPLASSDNVDFHIFTLKQPGKEAYDVVSNGEKWQACTQSAPVTLATPIGEKATVANGFSCYQEGDHWSWVYCKAKASNEQVQDSVDNGIKNRVEGDGLFALPLLTGKDAKSEGKSSIVIDISKSYSTFYNDKSFDLIKPDSKEQYLEAYIRFTPKAIIYPATVNLKIRGPKVEKENIIYFDQSILGYATNTPLLEPNRWIHVKIPLPTLYDVTSLEFKSSPEANTIEIRNVYLTYGDNPKICSGQASTEQSAWLADLDWWEEGKKVTGEKLCNVLFDPNYKEGTKGTAWLGNEGRCCGNNDKPEYYAGTSQAINDKDYYGCWNSEPVKANSSVMDVEVGVGYSEKTFIPNFPEKVSYSLGITPNTYHICAKGFDFKQMSPTETRVCDEEDVKLTNVKEYPYKFSSPILVTNIVPYFKTVNSNSKLTLKAFNKGKEIKSAESTSSYGSVSLSLFFDNVPTLIDSVTITSDTPFSLSFFSFWSSDQPFYNIKVDSSKTKVGTLSYIENEAGYTHYIKSDPKQGATISFSTGKTEISSEELKMAGTVDIFAQSTQLPTISSTPKSSATLTFSCTPPSDPLKSPEKSPECTYPLPGEPPYTITNPHPELYELYFVDKDDKSNVKETLITPAKSAFNTHGNLRVKKLAQQVVFTSDGTTANFYGCNAAKYLIDNTKVTDKNNKGYCNTAGNKYFCAPSVEKTIGQDKYTVIDSWSDQKLDRVGYDLTKADKPFDLKTYIPELRDIKDQPILAIERNHSSQVLPTRNFIPNAEFTPTNNKLPGWDLFKGNVVVPVEFLSTKDKTLTLKENEILRSERIAIPPNSKLKFTSKSSCQPTLQLVGDTIETITSPQEFETKNARYLIIEFTGPCTIQQPFLQLVDNKGAVKEYNYQNQEYISRAGIGCCPDNSCWNGYACVEDMTPFSQFAEHISDGRDYRCIQGTWTSSPVKYSWNGDQWGFCPKDNQCFVRPSDPANALLQSTYTIKDIYNKDNKATANLPLCINDKETILDHYCDNGEWTSRTKFIASKLIDIAGNDHYTLYCAPPQQIFLEYDNNQQYIFGINPVKEKPEQVELGKAPDTKPIQPSCFGFTPEISTKLGIPGLATEDRCINNVCILKFQDSGIQKTTFATSLNKAATDPTSFMYPFLPPQDVPTRCKSTDADKDKFVKCSLDGLDIKGELWYSPSFNAIMYSKDGITTSTSITDTILKFFKDLFGKTTTPEGKLPINLLKEAKNVKDIYLLRQGEKQVTAITEVKADKKTLIAEYKGFTTPICDYLTNFISTTDPNLKVQLLNQFTGQDKVRCITEGDTQRIEAIEGIDIFWPKLTGMLRVEEGK